MIKDGEAAKVQSGRLATAIFFYIFYIFYDLNTFYVFYIFYIIINRPGAASPQTASLGLG